MAEQTKPVTYNVEKARASGITDEAIFESLTKRGVPKEQAMAMINSAPKPSSSGLLRLGSESAGMLAGQKLGGILGGIAGTATPLGPAGTAPGAMLGRFAGGTIGNVAGTAGASSVPEVFKSLANTGRMLAGRTPKHDVNMPAVASGDELMTSLKEGAQASGLGEALPMAFKAGGMMRRGISKDTGFLKGITEMAEGLTGQDANEFMNLLKKPRAVFYRWMGGYKGTSRAWKEFEDFLSNSGIDPADVNFGYRETISTIKNSVFDLMDVAKATKDKIIAQLPTAHLIKMMRAAETTVKSSEITHGWGDIKALRKKLMMELAKRDDKLALAWGDVAASQLAKSFHSPVFGLMPKMGDKAAGYKLFYEIRRALPLILGGFGAATGKPEIALSGLGLGAAFSPMILGLPFAAGSAAVRGALKPPLVSSAVKSLQNFRQRQQEPD